MILKNHLSVIILCTVLCFLIVGGLGVRHCEDDNTIASSNLLNIFNLHGLPILYFENRLVLVCIK